MQMISSFVFVFVYIPIDSFYNNRLLIYIIFIKIRTIYFTFTISSNNIKYFKLKALNSNTHKYKIHLLTLSLSKT